MYEMAGRVADSVYQQRMRLGLSQLDLAERAGVSRHTVVNIESGHTGGIRLDTLSKVMNALGLQVGFFPRRATQPRADSDAAAAREHFRRRFMAGGDEHALLKARS